MKGVMGSPMLASKSPWEKNSSSRPSSHFCAGTRALNDSLCSFTIISVNELDQVHCLNTVLYGLFRHCLCSASNARSCSNLSSQGKFPGRKGHLVQREGVAEVAQVSNLEQHLQDEHPVGLW